MISMIANDDISLLGLCPFCVQNNTGDVYQWDYCVVGSEIEVDNDANGICIKCGSYSEKEKVNEC